MIGARIRVWEGSTHMEHMPAREQPQRLRPRARVLELQLHPLALRRRHLAHLHAHLLVHRAVRLALALAQPINIVLPSTATSSRLV